MHLYNLTLQPPTAITHAIVGNFSGARHQEIIVSRGTRLDLLRVDMQTGKLSTVVSTDAFGTIRCLAGFRLTGGTKGELSLVSIRLFTHSKFTLASVFFSQDHAILGSDSGRIVILDYDVKTTTFVKIHEETYGKSGARRVVPGQYLATDPKGRSVMISAVEKAKLVYILNRDAAANLTISSPLEAHKNQAIIHHIVGLDVGFENPTFAALEVEYSEADQDPTGEALNNAEKVCISLVPRLVEDCTDAVPVEADLLRARPWAESCRSEVERTDRYSRQPARTGTRRPARNCRRNSI